MKDLDLTDPSLNFNYLLQKIRTDLDPHTLVLTDKEIIEVMEVAAMIPYRIMNRCLILMKQKAFDRKDATLMRRARNLEFKFANGMLKINEEQFSDRC